MQQVKFYCAMALLVLLTGMPALAATMAQPSKPDPLLDAGPASPCMESPDYAGGIDVNGRPVAAADEGARPVPLPDAIAVPLHNGRQNGGQSGGHNGRQGARADSTYVSIDGKRLDPLVNPKPCH